MGKRQRPEELEVGSGLVLVDKPPGWTSHDVVGQIRKRAGTRKVGHAGTLDPMATGVLVVGINRGTRLLTHIVGVDKTYTATIRLGETTATDDADGEIRATQFANDVTSERITSAAQRLTGELMQVPSTVSAIKVAGRRAHERARAGEAVELASRPVTVYGFDVREIRRVDGGKLIDIDAEVRVSSGTYVRALARDIGELLETGGHLIALRRTAVGPYSAHQCLPLDHLGSVNDDPVRPANAEAEAHGGFGYIGLAEAAAQLFPVREVSPEEAEHLRHGRRITASDSAPEQLTAALTTDGQLIALLRNIPAKEGASSSPQAAQEAKTQRSAHHAKPELVFAP